MNIAVSENETASSCLSGVASATCSLIIEQAANVPHKLPRNLVNESTDKTEEGSIQTSNKTKRLITKVDNLQSDIGHNNEINNVQLEKAPLTVAIFTYMGFAVMSIAGFLQDLFQYFNWKTTRNDNHSSMEYQSLYRGCEQFFRNHIYNRVRHVFARPVLSNPGVLFDVEKVKYSNRNGIARRTGISTRCINLASYDYLGFADNNLFCKRNAIDVIQKNGVSTCAPLKELGINRIQMKLENRMAAFLGTEDCITFNMGFATNSCNIPAIVNKNCLVLSDELNHSSLVLGMRMSGARVRVFPHNDFNSLEIIIRDEIVQGHPRTHRQWKKIVIVVEGVYSMEGTVCRLPELIKLKKKYRCYLYLDEAHSIGAVGSHGRGIVDYYGCDVRNVDILMGTYSKSFSACGGYIAGSKALISHIRRKSHANVSAVSMSPPVCQQIISALSVITGESCPGEGERRIRSIASNSRYLYDQLKKAGFILYGDGNSPVIPILIYIPAKMVYFCEELYKRGIAVVGVGFPATNLLECRIRLCLSANLTKEMLDKIVQVITDVGRESGVLYRH